MSTSPRPSQWEAIRTVDQHVLVAAGAGTGKTTTVIGRILYLLGAPINGERVERPVALQEIAAITFTNAAAADLKGKLRGALREAGLRQLTYEVDSARIGTIHGFCGDILREFALRRGIAPARRIVEEGEALALSRDAVHDTVLRLLQEQSMPGLEGLFARYSVSSVENWVLRLSGESARLERIAEHRAELGELEQVVLDLALEARKEIERDLVSSGWLDFDRMIVWTRDLLRDNALALAALRKRIRCLIVDEFQDVDPLQQEIAYLLGDPRSRDPSTTRLMLVGDPKQSIYRFRRADVGVWREVSDDFAGAGMGRVVALEENFRSVEPILALVDATVGKILDRPIDGEALRRFEVPYAAVRATRGLDLAEPRVELLMAEVPPRTAVDQVRAVEAEAIARRMKELRKAGVEWKDMALLLAAWTGLEIYEGALRRAEIPTYSLQAEGFYQRREVVDLFFALETIRDPRDDRALMGFLRSPFVGVEDQTLLAIARQARRPYWEHVGKVRAAGPVEQARLAAAVGLIGDLTELRDRIPIHELLAQLLERTGYVAHLVALGPRGRQPIANLRKFLRIARDLRDRGVGDLLRAIRESRGRDDRVEDERLYGQRENVVTITSIHSAKGLEWSVVFWADLLRRGSGQRDGIVVGRDRIALKDPDLEKDEQPDRWKEMVAAEDAEQEAERKRLWYVAATRAKDRLVLSGFHTDKYDKGCGAALLLAELGNPALTDGAPVEYEGQGKKFSALVRVARGPVTAAPPEAEFTPAPLPDEAVPLPVAAGPVRHSATSLMHYARCPRRHWFRYVAGIPEPPVDRSGPEFGDAVTRGSIVHDVLEQLREEAELVELLETAIGRWDAEAPTPEEPGGREYREELRGEILAVSNHPAYRALDDRPGARRELHFVRLLGPERRIEGAADLAAPEGDGIAVLDVKTGGGDAASARQKAEGYALQRGVYASALSEIGGLPVDRFAFLFSQPGVEVSATLGEAERGAAAAAIAGMLARMGSETPALTKHPWECRYCGFKKVKWCEGAGWSGREQTGADGSG